MAETSSTPVAVWRSFLSGSDSLDAEPPITLLKTANEEAKAAKEDARSKEEQLELMTAMLHAAEDELKLRSNQLEITNAMLRATEAELVRKEEQLEITTQMLKTAEGEIGKGDAERRALRQELAAMRDSLSTATRRAAAAASAPAGSSSSSETRSNVGSNGAPPPASAATTSDARRRADAAELRRIAAAEAAAASKLADDLASVGTRAAGGGAEYPADLPENQQGGRYVGSRGGAGSAAGTPRVLLAHGDEAGAMQPKHAIRDSRHDTLSYIESRGINAKLPVTRTSMVIDQSDPDDDDSARRGVDSTYVRAVGLR